MSNVSEIVEWVDVRDMPFNACCYRDQCASDRAKIARLTEQVSGLEWLSSHTNLELSYHYGFSDDDDEPGWVIHRVTGPINDREWEQIARAPTVAAAIQTARETLTRMNTETDDE